MQQVAGRLCTIIVRAHVLVSERSGEPKTHILLRCAALSLPRLRCGLPCLLSYGLISYGLKNFSFEKDWR